MACPKRSKRDQILMTAWRLFESQGYHATGINQIINESGVPKGSFYHYFPEGKEGLAVEAIEAISDGMSGKVRSVCAGPDDCIMSITGMIRSIAQRLADTEYQEGGPLTTVALETATANERLNEACQRAYNKVHQEFVTQLVRGGFTEESARELSTTTMASLEGGILLSRTFHSTEPMEQIARQIESLMRQRHAGEPGSSSHALQTNQGTV